MALCCRCTPNGYKIAGPTVLAHIPRKEFIDLFVGYGYNPYFVEGDDPPLMHQLMASTLDKVIAEIKDIQAEARKILTHRAHNGR